MIIISLAKLMSQGDVEECIATKIMFISLVMYMFVLSQARRMMLVTSRRCASFSSTQELTQFTCLLNITRNP